MKHKCSQNINRDQIGFTSEVISAFNYLLTEYEFMCVRLEKSFVRYESISIFINIYHGRVSSELGVEIGKLERAVGFQENWYTIGELLDLMGVREKLKFTFFQASTRERIKKLIPKLAEYVREYAKPIFEGNHKIFEDMSKLRSKKSDEYMKEMNLRSIREASGKAWKEKDYAKLVELYNSMKDDLTLVELKKLSYAQKRLKYL